MREFYAANSAILASIDQAEEMMNQNKWGAASQTLNSLQEK
jgi:ribosome biogenesis protein Tsr3